MLMGAFKDHSLAQPPHADWSPQHGELMANLRAVVLLAGAVRPTHLRRAAGRFVLELPVEPGRSILDCWQGQLEVMAECFGLPRLPVRVMVDHAAPRPHSEPWQGRAELRIECDPLEFRGTGGLLRDLADEYDDDDLLLVAGAAQLMVEPLLLIADDLASTRGDVRILALRDGTPTGIMLIRCGCLRAIPSIGFIDLKEQALPTIARRHEVVIARRDRAPGLPVRTMPDYLDAVREYHCRMHGIATEPSAYAEDWRPTFSLIEEGAQVDPSAIIHDSVVLADGCVEASTVLVRSVVCPGGRLESGQSVVDRLVLPVRQGKAEHVASL